MLEFKVNKLPEKLKKVFVLFVLQLAPTSLLLSDVTNVNDMDTELQRAEDSKGAQGVGGDHKYEECAENT